jgi:glycosyltransferase involved in cell wall biosynthesis
MGGRKSHPPKLFVVAENVPAFDRHSGYQRLYRILGLLRTRYAITFIAYGADPSYETAPYVRALETLGIEVRTRTFRRRHFWRARGDAVLLETYRAAESWLDCLRLLNPALPIIIDSVDLHYLREQRMAEFEPRQTTPQRALEIRTRELAMYGKADAVITVSEHERALLLKELPGLDVAVVSNIHDVDGPAMTRESRIPDSMLFVGGFGHSPNVDAVLFFCQAILPLIRRALPSGRVWIVGSSPTEKVLALNALPGVEVLGYVQDLDHYLRTAWVSIAPLRYGAGVKGKIGEAMAAGLPVVTTPTGAEGMRLENRVTAMIADSAQEFADAVTELSRNRVLHATIARNGLEHVRRAYAPSRADDSLVQLLESVASRPPKRISLGERLRVCSTLIAEQARRVLR